MSARTAAAGTVRVPPAVPRGARIAVIAPGSAVRRESLAGGLEMLRRWGYEAVPGPHLLRRRGDLAGDDAGRAADLEWAFRAPDIAAVWAARGGWGTPRVLESLDLDAMAARPRWLLGFSDVTALHAALVARGVATLHAPLVAELATPSRYVAADVRGWLDDPMAPRTFRPGPRRALVPGRAEGTLAGGCLSLLAALAGTPWQPDFSDAVLFLEDVGEAPYRIDRMLWQVRAAGMLEGVAGVALGQFVNCRPPAGRPSRSLAAVLREHALALGVPVLGGIPAGHGPRSRVLPLGYRAVLDATRGAMRVEPPGGAGSVDRTR